MDPDKKQLIIMLSIVGVLLIVVGFLMLRPSPPKETSIIPPLSVRGGEVGLLEGNNSPQPSLTLREGEKEKANSLKAATPEQQDAAAVSALARSFAELFGTYSSERGAFYGVPLSSLSTSSFQDWFKTSWPKVAAGIVGKTYQSFTARALSVKLVTHDPVSGKANAEVMIQQEQVVGQARSVQYRTLVVEAVRQNKQWLIDRASWK